MKRFALFALLYSAVSFGQTTIYVTGPSVTSTAGGFSATVPIYDDGWSSFVVTKLTTKCQDVAVTTKQADADYVYTTQAYTSVLTDKNSKVIFASNAMTGWGAAKDLCNYFKKRAK